MVRAPFNFWSYAMNHYLKVAAIAIVAVAVAKRVPVLNTLVA